MLSLKAFGMMQVWKICQKPVDDCVNANLEEFLNTCNVKITQSLDKHAPFRKFKKKVRPRRKWFSEELQVQRGIVRNREKTLEEIFA